MRINKNNQIFKKVFILSAISVLLASSLYAAPNDNKQRAQNANNKAKTTNKNANTRKQTSQHNQSQNKQNARNQVNTKHQPNQEITQTIGSTRVNKAGVFIGAGLGVGIGARTAIQYYDNGNKTNRHSRNLGLGFDWDTRLGFQFYMGKFNGIRIYASYGMSHIYKTYDGRSTGTTSNTHLDYTVQRILGNVDYMLDFVQNHKMAAGVFAGVYAGYSELAETRRKELGNGDYARSSTFYGGAVIGFNLGVGITMAKHHRIDIMARVPIMDLVYQGIIYSVPNGSDTTSGGSNTNGTTNARGWYQAKFPSALIVYNFIF